MKKLEIALGVLGVIALILIISLLLAVWLFNIRIPLR